MVSLSSDHFWGGIAWTSTGCLQSILVVLVSVAQSEVDNLNVHVLVKKQIFRFQITMAHFDLVQVFDSGKNLMEEAAGLTV